MKSEEIAKGKKITKPEPIKTNSDKIKSGMKWGEFFLASVGFIFFRIIVPLLWGLGSMVRAFWKWFWGKKKRSRRVYKG
jgi:hypothetical protein